MSTDVWYDCLHFTVKNPPKVQGGPPTRYNLGYNSYNQGYNPSYPIMKPFIGVITPFITGRPTL